MDPFADGGFAEGVDVDVVEVVGRVLHGTAEEVVEVGGRSVDLGVEVEVGI